MSNFQEVKRKAISELSSLEKVLKEIEQTKNKNEDSFRNINLKLEELNESLSLLKESKQNLPFSHYYKINLVVGITTLIVMMISWILFGILVINLIISSPFPQFQQLLLGFISVTLGVPTIGILEGYIGKKIQQLLEQKSYDRITKSKEYQKVLEKAKTIEREISKTNYQKEITKKEIQLTNSKYYNYVAEVSVKRAIANYNENEGYGTKNSTQTVRFTRIRTIPKNKF